MTTNDPRSVAEEAVAGTEPASVPAAMDLVDGATALLRQGGAIVKAGGSLTAELSRIALGRSDLAAERSDWRFKDPTWSQNPAYRRIAQAYLAACGAVDKVVDSVEASGPGPRAQRARFVSTIATSALAPTNTLVGNPAALKKALETGGTSLLHGVKNWASDLRHNGGMPSMARPGALTVGQDLAVTPGAVVDVDERAELLQYTPTTKTVRARPLLVVPPPIGRYYFLDLRPGRSFVEYSVSRGLQTFLLSWRNPGRDQADWNIETYAERILTAIDQVREITGSDDVNVIGFCAGGILNTVVLNHLASRNDRSINSASYAVTLLDFGQSAPISAFSSARLMSLARRNSKRAGVISARAMGSAFTWMRPNDLVWNYWVNNYLLGQDPPVFDILAWNADGTNLPAALHHQFLDIFEHNPLVRPDALTALGSPIDLSTINVSTYATAAINDHLTPWKGCFRTTELMSGECTFVLSNAGHIASLVNPPNNPKASYFEAPLKAGESPEGWLSRAEKKTGSWWEHWADWAVERSGEEIPAPRRLGSPSLPERQAAPGAYVLAPN